MISDLLDYRGNVQFFDEERIPPKEDIMSILNTVHDKMPHVNYKWLYRFSLLGPDEVEEKRKIAISSLCGSKEKDVYYRTADINQNDINHLYNIYDQWRKYQREKPRINLSEGQNEDPDIYTFNDQVTAPWVIVYRRTGPSRDERRSYVQIGNHSMLTALLALEKGYDVSFCSCLIFRPEFNYKFWNEKDKRTPIMTLSIGWPLLPRRTQATNSKLFPQFGNGPGIKPDLESIMI
tara:strand:- start:1891 stop:2595 length:705 start_codon:yes stop_codon:yes gene_type:complete